MSFLPFFRAVPFIVRSRVAGRYSTLLIILVSGCLAADTSPQVASVELSHSNGVHFSAIGDTLRLGVLATDLNGASVPPDEIWFGSRDPLVAVVDDDGLIRSIGDGETRIVVNAGPQVFDSITVSVAQARDSLVVALSIEGPILTVSQGATVPLSCRAFDAGGNPLTLTVDIASSAHRLVGTDCGNLRAQHSGYDTLIVRAGKYITAFPVIVAVRPVVVSDPAARFPADSLPSGAEPWAPTLVQNPRGDLDLYFAGYFDAPPPRSGVLGDLHRLTSSDGTSFRYDKVALRRDRSACSLQDTGIENLAIVPRAGGGWRMFFAAGGRCYGWQVFSATSSDQVTWTKEPGVRVSNGGTIPPADPGTPPWPAGEGMALDRRDDGSWRMLIGAYEHLVPRENRFQIVEWTSPDQVAWSYVAPVLTTRQVGPAANRSVYSPSIHKLAPGLRRMYFTGDDLNSRNGRSRIYTAVTTDGAAWQIEGPLLDSPTTDFYYSSFASGLLAFIRSTGGGPRSLGLVRVLSP